MLRWPEWLSGDRYEATWLRENGYEILAVESERRYREDRQRWRSVIVGVPLFLVVLFLLAGGLS